MYSIVASDLDGTLLSPNHILTPYTQETLHLLINKGVHFVFATGRHHVDVAQIRDGLGINAYMITSNGARVHNTHGDLIFSQDLEPEIAYDLALMVFDHPEIETNIYAGDYWYVNKEMPGACEFFRESDFGYELYCKTGFPTTNVCKVFFTSEDHELLLKLENEINQLWGDKVNVSFSLRNCLEVMAGGVSKGEALERVAELMQHSAKDAIAFGDGMNDKEMLQMAGKGCIMENAHQTLKDLLPNMEVIGTNADEAVPHYLRKLYQV